MASVEGWDGKKVHQGQNQRKYGGDFPECLPVPGGWKQTGDGTKAAEAVGCFNFSAKHLSKGFELITEKAHTSPGACCQSTPK